MVRINGNFDFQSANIGAGSSVFSANGTPEAQQPIPIGQGGGQDNIDRQARIEANRARKAELQAQIATLRASMPAEPVRPEPDGTMITVRTDDYSTLSGLANRYFCTEDDIRRENPRIERQGLWPNSEYVIPTASAEKRDAYNAVMDQRKAINSQIYELNDQIRALDNAIEVDQKIICAESVIGKIQSSRKSDHFDEFYTMSIDYNTGNIILKFKDERAMNRVKRDFGLADGVILANNGADKLESFGRRPDLFYSNYDDRIAPVDATLKIPPESCARWIDD